MSDHLNKRGTYTPEFKQDAIRLSNEPGQSVSKVAKGLGIDYQLLARWRREAMEKGQLAFPGNGKEALTQEQKRIQNLERQLKDVEMERDILKKAVGIFSRLPK